MQHLLALKHGPRSMPAFVAASAGDASFWYLNGAGHSTSHVMIACCHLVAKAAQRVLVARNCSRSWASVPVVWMVDMLCCVGVCCRVTPKLLLFKTAI